jgi:hypothetical protein
MMETTSIRPRLNRFSKVVATLGVAVLFVTLLYPSPTYAKPKLNLECGCDGSYTVYFWVYYSSNSRTDSDSVNVYADEYLGSTYLGVFDASGNPISVPYTHQAAEATVNGTNDTGAIDCTGATSAIIGAVGDFGAGSCYSGNPLPMPCASSFNPCAPPTCWPRYYRHHRRHSYSCCPCDYSPPAPVCCAAAPPPVPCQFNAAYSPGNNTLSSTQAVVPILVTTAQQFDINVHYVCALLYDDGQGHRIHVKRPNPHDHKPVPSQTIFHNGNANNDGTNTESTINAAGPSHGQATLSCTVSFSAGTIPSHSKVYMHVWVNGYSTGSQTACNTYVKDSQPCPSDPHEVTATNCPIFVGTMP